MYYLCPKVKGTGMKKDEGFSVEVESRYEGWWRYNVTILCGCFDADGNRIGYGGVPFGDMHYRINQWSGASLEIKLRNDGKPFRA